MKVLVACEESQVVCKAFRLRGHEAFSCDLQKCSGGRPSWHIQGDVLNVLYDDWDLVIAFPPCTYICLINSIIWSVERQVKMEEAVKFFNIFLSLDVPYCIENPVPMKRAGLPNPTQYINPYQFGHPYTKKTGLWLHDLPKLKPTNIVYPYLGEYHYSGPATSIYRSKTFHGVAAAMAAQWG